MSHTEPQITEIASYFATALPADGAPREESVQAWRKTLRYARKSGAIEPLAEMIRHDAGDDTQVERYCEELVR